MNTPPRFCNSCGTPLNPGARFCNQCGRAVQSAPQQPSGYPPASPPPSAPPPLPDWGSTFPAAPPAQMPPAQPPPVQPSPSSQQSWQAQPPPAPQEPIVAILPSLVRRSGFMGMKSENFNLVLTPARLVFAAVSQDLMKWAVAAARDESKQQGKGFFGQWGAQMKWMGVILRQYEQMPVDHILLKYPGSFYLPNPIVHKVRLKDSQMDNDGNSSPAQVIFETQQGKFTFDLAGISVRDAKNLLHQTLGNLVR